MKTLTEHLRDRIQFGFTVANSVSDKIILFDLDDTIINTTAEITVYRNGKFLKRISNTEYNDYVPKSGESLGFEDFCNVDILNKETFTRYWETLKREYRKGTHIGILTARSDSKMIKRFFLGRGINIKDELVIAVNDPSLGLSGTIQDRKSEAIDILANAGYKTFIFFDDNLPNLKAAKELENKLDIKVHTVHV